jgi:hypothetical protein
MSNQKRSWQLVITAAVDADTPEKYCYVPVGSDSMIAMSNNQPETRWGEIRWPNEAGANPTARSQAVEQAAWREARASVADGELVYGLRIDTALVEWGNDSVMVYLYSYQVFKLGGQAADRSR